MIRGSVYQVDLGKPRGHQQGGRRYGLVISPSNSPLTVVTIIPTSTAARAASFRPEIELAGQTTRLLVDQLRTIDTDYVGEPVDYLTHDQMTRVEEVVAHYLGLPASLTD